MAGLCYERENGIGRVWIDRPEAKNALDRAVVDRLDGLMDLIAADPAVKVLLVGGSGDFAAGADIGEMVDCTPAEAKAFAFTDTFDKLERLEIPTLAVIDGFALGGGLELALACDLRLAAVDAQLGMPEVGLGIMPGAGGTVRLPKLIGYARAFEFICLGGRVDGKEAEELGIVNRAVPKQQLTAVAQAWAEKLVRRPGKALRAAKRSMRTGDEAVEREIWAELFASHDQKEGMRSFLERRRPVFVNG